MLRRVFLFYVVKFVLSQATKQGMMEIEATLTLTFTLKMQMYIKTCQLVNFSILQCIFKLIDNFPTFEKNVADYQRSAN